MVLHQSVWGLPWDSPELPGVDTSPKFVAV